MGYRTDPKHSSTRIIWNNVVTWILLWYEHQLATFVPSTDGTAQIHPSSYAMVYLQAVIPLFIHECRSHVYKAVKEWIVSRKRSTQVKALGEHIVGLFKHLAVEMTATSSLSQATTLLSSVIVILSSTTIPVESFDMQSPVREHRDHNAMKTIARSLYDLKKNLASSMRIRTRQDLEERVGEVMELNDKESKQSFIGNLVAKDVIDQLTNSMPFSYTYLYSINATEKKGVLHTHIIHDAELDDEGEICPVFAGYFTTTVSLPYNSGSIMNPLHCMEAADYLSTTWLPKTSLWSRAAIDLLQLLTKLLIFGNNQHAEGIIKYIKAHPDLKLHCQQMATYLHWQWTNIELTSKQLVLDYKNLNASIERKKIKHDKKLNKSTTATADSIENERLNNTDAGWGISAAYQGVRGDRQLKQELEDAFVIELSRTNKRNNNTQTYAILKAFVEGPDCGNGHLNGLGYGKFGEYMDGHRTIPLQPKNKAALISFVKHYAPS